MTIPAIYGRFAILYRIKRWRSNRRSTKEFNILCKYFPPRNVAQMMINHEYGVSPIKIGVPLSFEKFEAFVNKHMMEDNFPDHEFQLKPVEE